MDTRRTIEGELGFQHGPIRKDDLVHWVQICEPDIHDIRWGSIGGDRLQGSAKENAIAWDICALLESFEAQTERSSYRALWFRVPRGTIEDWMGVEEYRGYAEMYDSNDEDVAAAWQKEWAESFPDECYWHTLEVNWEDGWAVVGVDSKAVIEVRPDETVPYENPRLKDALEKLRSVAVQLVNMALRGRYQKLISEELPPHCRFGFVRRGIWWKRLGKESLFDDGKMGQEEARQLAELIAAQPDEDDMGRLSELSAGQYFKALKGAYEAAGFIYDGKYNYRKLSSDDGRAWYARFGDARDESILELDQDSPKAFETWFHDRNRFFNHTFEILEGPSISRVHLSPRHDERGWYCVLSGAITWRAVDMARIWRHLNANGFPTFLYEARDIADMLLGQDDLLVVPFNKDIWYRGTEHFGKHVVTCVHLPEENADSIIGDVDWVEGPEVELSVVSADLDAFQVRELIEALDFYSRMWMGQYKEVEWRMRFAVRDLKAIEADQPLRERKWLEMRNLVLPETIGMALSGSYGIWNPEVCDRAQCAYDMQQVIRHAWAWHRKPEGGIGVSFDRPWIRGLLPAVGCSCSGEGESAHCSIHLLPAHARLAIEALEVFQLLSKGRIRELMEHYTDNAEALSIAQEIEQLIPPVVGEQARDSIGHVDDPIAFFKAHPSS